MANIAAKFGLGGGGGIHFKEPWQFSPWMAVATELSIYDSGAAARTSATTAFFTEMARRGLQDQTNWTADTYKTLLNVASGKGKVAAIIACTAGGAEITTFEITVDGVLTEIAVGTLASGERACLLTCGPSQTSVLATDAVWLIPGGETLEADKATFGAVSGAGFIPTWSSQDTLAVPCLRFNQSLLIRAKHSASITNSTATAYSAVMYRLGL